MACSPAFPAAMPSDCLGNLAGIVLRKEFSARRREALWAGLKILEYFGGQLVTQPAGEAGTLANRVELTDAEAADFMQVLSTTEAAHVLDKAKVLLLVEWIAKLLPLLLG